MPLSSATRHHALLRVLHLLLLTAALPAAAEQLSPEERRIVAWVDAHAEKAVGLLERVVNINSGTMNPEGVRAVGKVLHEELDALGMQPRWVEMPEAMHRAGHLFAETKGNKGKRVLLIGHLDTVFEKDSPFQRFERQGSTARGPGVADMKGGDVVMVYALKALHAAGVLDGAQVIAAFTGDEESAGHPLEVARQELVEAAKRSDVALEFETATRDGKQEYAVVARRSSTSWQLDVKARPGHSSGIFQKDAGSGAIFEAARILNAFHQELRGEPNLTFNPGVILGGTEVQHDELHSRGTAFGKTNVIAGTAVVTGDLRTLTDAQLQRVRKRMLAIAARSLPHATSTLTFSDGYPSMPPTAGNRALLERLNRVSRDLGLRPLAPFDPGLRGAADVSFVAPYVDSLAGLGVHGSGMHSVEETVDLESLSTAVKRTALLVYRLTQQPRS